MTQPLKSKRIGDRPMKTMILTLTAVVRDYYTFKVEAAKGRTHLSIFKVSGDGTMNKRVVRIEDVLKGFEFAAKALQEGTERWLWN